MELAALSACKLNVTLSQYVSSELSAYGGPPGTRPESRLRLMRSTVTLVSWLYAQPGCVSRECTTVLL